MRPRWVLAALLALPGIAAGQAVSTLRVTVTLLDAAGTAVPVGRHALLISDNPSTSEPRRVFTAVDGTVTGTALPTGHFVPEELPDATADELARHFG